MADSVRTSVSANPILLRSLVQGSGYESIMKSKTARRSYRAARSVVAVVAEERIQHLLSQAHDMVRTRPDLSKRYVELARKISMRTKVRIKTGQKQYLCKKCSTLLVPGYNARVRLRPGRVRVVTCLSCDSFRRYPFYSRK